MLTITALNIYPVKSLGGISLQSSFVTARGLEYDRRWMLVDEYNQFLTQREFPVMALLKTSISGEFIKVSHLADPVDAILLPLTPAPAEVFTVQVWGDSCEAQAASSEINEWFSGKLGIRCKAVYMPETSHRKVDPVYAVTERDITSFSDGYPILLLGDASLEDLNQRLDEKVSMDRFRPSIVFKGGEPFMEDEMLSFQINGLAFAGVKLCGRCVITTTDQQTGERGKEPLRTLATYRSINNKVCFGQNVICLEEGRVSVGDGVIIKKSKN